jgi:hypothetical protein
MSEYRSDEETTGSSLPPPEIPSLSRPGGASTARPNPAPQDTPASIGLPPPEIKPLTAPAPLPPTKSKRPGCTAILIVFVVLVVVAAFLVWWFVLRAAP